MVDIAKTKVINKGREEKPVTSSSISKRLGASYLSDGGREWEKRGGDGEGGSVPTTHNALIY